MKGILPGVQQIGYWIFKVAEAPFMEYSYTFI